MLPLSYYSATIMFIMVYTDTKWTKVLELKWTSVVRLNAHVLYTGQELDQTEDEELMSWESFMKENYLASLQQDSSQSMEHRLEITAEK